MKGLYCSVHRKRDKIRLVKGAVYFKPLIKTNYSLSALLPIKAGSLWRVSKSRAFYQIKIVKLLI